MRHFINKQRWDIQRYIWSKPEIVKMCKIGFCFLPFFFSSFLFIHYLPKVIVIVMLNKKSDEINRWTPSMALAHRLWILSSLSTSVCHTRWHRNSQPWWMIIAETNTFTLFVSDNSARNILLSIATPCNFKWVKLAEKYNIT